MDFLAHLRDDGARFSSIAQGGDPAAEVRSCPGWALRDLVAHLGSVHRFIHDRVAAGTEERLDLERPRVPDGDLGDWYDEGLAQLLDVLERTPPDAPAWNWSAHEPKTAAFWPRRMAQETAVHRWDAEAAVGDVTPIDADLAADGVDEWIAVHIDSDVADPDQPEPPAGLGSLHLHCTDVPGEWWAAVDGRTVTVRREHAKGDVAARGRAEDLLLVCWRRLPTTAVEVVGDPAVLDAWLALASR